MNNIEEHIDEIIVKLKNCETLVISSSDYHWIVLIVERFEIPFKLNFIVKISNEGIILTGLKDA